MTMQTDMPVLLVGLAACNDQRLSLAARGLVLAISALTRERWPYHGPIDLADLALEHESPATLMKLVADLRQAGYLDDQNRLRDEFLDLRPAATSSPEAEENPTAGYGSSQIYYLRRANGDIKIGISKYLNRRRANLESHYGPLELLATEPGSMKTERRRHATFADLRILDAPKWQGNEWFRSGRPLLEHIERLASAEVTA